MYILYTSGCCHKDTLIQLSSGEIKRIENLVKEKGSKVTNINLNTLKEENDEITAKYHYQQEPYLFQIQTPLSSILVTPNHPFFVLEKDGAFVEKEARTLQKGDHIMMAKKIEFFGERQELPKLDINYQEKKCTKRLPNKPDLPKYLNSCFAELLGVLLGDGSLKPDRVEITDKDIQNLLYYKKLFNQLGLRAEVKKYSRQKVIVNSRYFSQFLKEAFPEVFANSHQRDIPIIIQKAQTYILAAFIRGLYNAEGSVITKNPSVKIVSTSKLLIQKLALLLLRFEVVTSYCEELRKTHFGPKQYMTPVYELRITDRESLYQFSKKIGFSSLAKQDKLQKLLRSFDRKRVGSMIYFLPLNNLIKKIRETIRLNKKESRRVFLDSYEHTNRRTTINHLSYILQYIQKLIKEINSVRLSNIPSIRKAVYICRISQKELAEISNKSINTVHKYLHANKQGISEESHLKFIQTIIPYVEKIKKEKIHILSEIFERIKKLESLKNVGFFEIKKITVEKNDKDFCYVYDKTTEKNHNYIANGFIVHNSTGKPKGVVHSHGGYMVGTYITLKWVFNLQPDDIYWCTADAGWVTGHSYIVYSPLLNGITTFIYESVPDYPDPGKWWSLIEKYKVTKFYTAPTAIRAAMRYGEEWPKKYDLSSLKILGSVGEPINPEAWLWYYKNIGGEKCPIMDTWWQTETGMFILTPLPSVPLKPGSCFKPFFGIVADVVDEQGNSLFKKSRINHQTRSTFINQNLSKSSPSVNQLRQGYLVIRTPWPAMLLDVYGDPKKYRETYFEKIQISNIKNQNENIQNLKQQKKLENSDLEFRDFLYFTGDSAKIDEDGYFWIVGRNDDVIKVSGHRLGSAEIEHAIVDHPSVAEAAVIGKPHPIKGESIKAFVILKIGEKPSEELKKEINNLVRKEIGPIASIDEIEFVDVLPKTRSGKIMRRVLKAKELGLPLGDTSTLES
ncbi:MAG: AMP-binding protein [Microgenomates group bacterium]